MLEITEQEHNHELLLSVKNFQEFGVSPFPYIFPILPRPFPEELVKGEHFVLKDLLKSIPGSSSQAGSAQEPQAEIVEGALVSFVRLNQSPLAVQDPKPTPQAVKKKKGNIKAADTGLKGFVEWADSIASDSAEERDEDMSSLAVGFSMQMGK